MRADSGGVVTASEYANNSPGDARCRRNINVTPFGNNGAAGGVCGANADHDGNAEGAWHTPVTPSSGNVRWVWAECCGVVMFVQVLFGWCGVCVQIDDCTASLSAAAPLPQRVLSPCTHGLLLPGEAVKETAYPTGGVDRMHACGGQESK